MLEEMDSCLFRGYQREVKYKLSCPGFELELAGSISKDGNCSVTSASGLKDQL